MEPAQSEVRRFWLEEVGPARWYRPDTVLDGDIHRLFRELWSRAGAGACDSWRLTPGGALALLILLDQFPRNMFRGTATAFATDPRARRIASFAIARGHDRATPEPERQFFYLPFMHSESLPDQERCVRLIAMNMPMTGSDNLAHARRHREVIRRFGRFPSRNAALGRPDTEAERAYRVAGGYMS